MKLTLREALTLAEPLRKAQVLAGAQGLDNVVASVNVMEVPDILDWVHPGELLVTTMYPLRDDRKAIARLVPGLAKKGLAGLAVTVEPYLEDRPDGNGGAERCPADGARGSGGGCGRLARASAMLVKAEGVRAGV